MRARRYREMCLVLHRVVVVVVVGGDRGIVGVDNCFMATGVVGGNEGWWGRIVGVDNCFMATGLLGCGWDRGFVLWLHGNAVARAVGGI